MRRRRSLRDKITIKQQLPTLVEMMGISLLSHEDGGIWVFHDKPFPESLDHVEYDIDEGKIYFIGTGGSSIELGIPVDPKQSEKLKNCDILMAAYVQNDDVKDMKMVSFITRGVNKDKEKE